MATETTDVPGAIAVLVKSSREEAQISQERLARDIGVSKGTIQHIEAGRRQPSIAVIGLLSMRFGWNLPWSGDPSARNTWFVQTLEMLLERARGDVAV